MEERTAPEKKQRIPVWLYPSTIDRIEQLYRGEKCKSHSEFIEKAVEYYCGYLYTNARNPQLPDAVAAAIEGKLGSFEDRFARLMFKYAVEQAIMMHIVAYDIELDDTQLDKLRGKCIADIKHTNGQISFKDVLRFQKSV